MGFQVNGTEYVNSSGHFTNGLKTANSQAMTGSGAITTGQTSTYGANYNVVGSMTMGVAMYYYYGSYYPREYTASGNYGFANTVNRIGCEVDTTIPGSEIYYADAPYNQSNRDYWNIQGTSGIIYYNDLNTPALSPGSGTWRALDNSSIDAGYWYYGIYQLFIRIS